MRVLVTGATGLIGGRLGPRLAGAGHTVWALSRRRDPATGDGSGIARYFHWPDPSAPPPAESLAETDAVVHLAGESVSGRWTAAKKARIRASRIGSTTALVTAIAALPPARRPAAFVCASASGYYGDRGDAELREGDAPGSGFLAEVCRAWEASAARARELGLAVTHLRTSLVLAAEGGALAAMRPLFRLGLGGPLGGGDQWWSWIAIDDQVRLIQWALERRFTGALNAAAPNPLRQKEFARLLARRLGRPSCLPAPAFGVQLLLGEFAGELLASRRLLPAAAEQAGFSFETPALPQALEQEVPR